MSTVHIGRGCFIARANGEAASGTTRAKAKAKLMRKLFGGAS